MSYLRGQDRSQTQLLPPCLDDYVPANAPVRFIDAYVEGLDFQGLGFSHAQPSATGRPPYHPADLLKLYLYGYLNRIRSSRRLEAEAGRNLELMWLIRGVRPDFKTIADFRKDSRAAFKPLFKNFNLLCRQLGLFGAELVAIDGSKFKAVNNSRRHYTQQQLGELMQKIESRIEEYLGQLDEQDEGAHGVAAAPSASALQEKLALLEERKGRYEELLGELQNRQQNEVSLTDPDARKMKGAHGHLMAYNVQVAVDAKHDLIAVEEVTQAANDLGQLATVAVAAQTELQAKQLQVVADKGYHAADQLEACEQAGIETFIPAQTQNRPKDKDGKPLFAKEQFRYELAADVYHCPGGQKLPRTGQEQHEGKERHIYSHVAACRVCVLRAQCTAGSHRRIVRRSNEAVVERAATRVAGRPDLVAQRKEVVEHPFGTLRLWGCGEFLMRGLEKVRAEFSLSALTYNLRRVLNLLPIADLIAALQRSRSQRASAGA
jgi:transposase